VRKYVVCQQLLALLALIVLGGCGLLSGTDKVRDPHVGASVILAPAPAVKILVTLDARDRSSQMVEAIELVSPDGQSFAPKPDQQLVSRQPYSYATLPGVRGSGSSGQVPDNFSIIPPTNRRSEFVSVAAVIKIPDMETYRRTYRRWTVLVVLSGIDGKMRKIIIPAPPGKG